MDILAIQTVVQTALLAVPLPNVLVRKYYTQSVDDVVDLYFDKSIEPPQINFLIITARQTGSQRYASSQILQEGIVEIEIYLAFNNDANTEETLRLNTELAMEAVQNLFTYNDLVDRTLAPQVGSAVKTDVKGFSSWKVVITQRFEVMQVVNYV